MLNGTDSCLTLNGYFTIFDTAYELPLPAEPAVLDFESLIMLPSWRLPSSIDLLVGDFDLLCLYYLGIFTPWNFASVSAIRSEVSAGLNLKYPASSFSSFLGLRLRTLASVYIRRVLSKGYIE